VLPLWPLGAVDSVVVAPVPDLACWGELFAVTVLPETTVETLVPAPACCGPVVVSVVLVVPFELEHAATNNESAAKAIAVRGSLGMRGVVPASRVMQTST
jgi:hypothetical protein